VIAAQRGDDSLCLYPVAWCQRTHQTRLWLLAKVTMAVASGVTLSEYMRRALAAYYLGRTLTDPLKG